MGFFEDYNYLYPPDHIFTVRFPYINKPSKYIEFYIYSQRRKRQLKPHRIITPPRNSEYNPNQEKIYEWHLMPAKYYVIKRSIYTYSNKKVHHCQPYLFIADKLNGLIRIAVKWTELPSWIPWTCECVKSLSKAMRGKEPKIHPRQRWW